MGEVRRERERASYTGGTLARNTRGVWGVVCHKCDKWKKRKSGSHIVADVLLNLVRDPNQDFMERPGHTL